MKPNDKGAQVGGSHYYTGGLQHWDIVAQCYMNDYFAGQISRYICRWRNKGGVQDLKKALHFLNKAHRVWEYNENFGTWSNGRSMEALEQLENFFALNSFDEFQKRLLVWLFNVVHNWTPANFDGIQQELRSYIEEQEAAEPGPDYVKG